MEVPDGILTGSGMTAAANSGVIYSLCWRVKLVIDLSRDFAVFQDKTEDTCGSMSFLNEFNCLINSH